MSGQGEGLSFGVRPEKPLKGITLADSVTERATAGRACILRAMGIFFWDSVPSDDWDLCQLGHLSDCWGFGIVDDGESGIKTKRSAWQHYPIWTH